MNFGSRPLTRSWLSTFKKPHVTAIGRLAHQIVEVSLSNAETLKSLLKAEDEKKQLQRWFLVVSEFLYFFMHLTNRFSFSELGHDRRCKVQDQLYPLVVRPTIEAIFGHWPPNLKDGIENEFREKVNDAEIEYGECKQMLNRDNPFSRDGLFTMFAGNVCELLGVGKDDPAAYAESFMKVTDLALDAFKQLNLSEAVRAIGKEL